MWQRAVWTPATGGYTRPHYDPVMSEVFFAELGILRSCDRLRDTLLASAGRAGTSGMLARLGPRPRQYGIPCLTLRDRTERPITVAEDTDRLAGREPDRIVTAAHDVIAGSRAPRAGWPTHCGLAD